jgi:hypothetical protein
MVSKSPRLALAVLYYPQSLVGRLNQLEVPIVVDRRTGPEAVPRRTCTTIFHFRWDVSVTTDAR